MLAGLLVPGGLPAAAQPENLLAGANAEETSVYENLWDGVDAADDVRVCTESLPVLPEGGGTSLQATPFPCSPAFVDMNGDGRPDLIVGDAAGFLWIFLNSGSLGRPAFTQGTYLRTFIGFGSKIHPTDWNGDGDIDILVGTFYGDVVVLENLGTPQAYQFVSSKGIPRYVDPRFDAPANHRLESLQLGSERMLLGTYMAPWVHDWNGDGKPDLLLGEGTYSANSVRLLLNAGTSRNPKFVKDKVFFLAWGEGREHLTPAVADFNGDDVDDLLTGTRKGLFRLHSGTPAAEKTSTAAAAYLRKTPPPALLNLDREWSIPGVDSMSAAYPCDWNEDGLNDLLLGGTDGRVRIALNTGTPEQPQYGEPTAVRGIDTRTDRLRSPTWFVPNGFSVWSPNHWERSRFRSQNMSNAAFLFTAEEQLPGAAGKGVEAVEGKRFMHFRYLDGYLGWVGGRTEGGRILVHSSAFTLKIRNRYTLSFSRNGGKGGMSWLITGVETTKPASEANPSQHELRNQTKSFGASPNAWRKQDWSFRYDGKNKDQEVQCHFYILLPPGDCEVALDDFQLVEVEP